jgi:hypothetical protein
MPARAGSRRRIWLEGGGTLSLLLRRRGTKTMHDLPLGWLAPGRLVRLAGLFLVLMLVYGCGPRIVYDYVPPASDEGRICAVQCQSTATNCRQMSQMVNQQCQNNYNAMLQNYNACREAGAKHCIGPTPCPYNSASECDRNYRECFAACGGSVIARTIE